MIINNGSNSARYIDRHSGYDLSGIDLQSASISRAGSVHIAEASPRGAWMSASTLTSTIVFYGITHTDPPLYAFLAL